MPSFREISKSLSRAAGQLPVEIRDILLRDDVNRRYGEGSKDDNRHAMQSIIVSAKAIMVAAEEFMAQTAPPPPPPPPQQHYHTAAARPLLRPSSGAVVID